VCGLERRIKPRPTGLVTAQPSQRADCLGEFCSEKETEDVVRASVIADPPSEQPGMMGKQQVSRQHGTHFRLSPVSDVFVVRRTSHPAGTVLK